MPQSDIRFFTEDWIITLPSHPDVQFIRHTPANHNEDEKIMSNPLNHPFAIPEVWDEEKQEKFRQRFIARFELSKTKFQALYVLVQVEGRIVGSGGVYEIPEVQAGVANIGLALDASVRGKGLGKATMQVLLRLSNELDVPIVQSGTTNANTPMRALAASLGFTEKQELLDFPGRGVVSEILFENVNYKKWVDLAMDVEFKGPISE